ncbi:hypothetical protein K438DRAFT_1762906 [Mycena galopus ATCC 62051]|nr:hypothetical protein K438DRAFT_1762906 [Mycena galopus ATCC 62051]
MSSSSSSSNSFNVFTKRHRAFVACAACRKRKIKIKCEYYAVLDDDVSSSTPNTPPQRFEVPLPDTSSDPGRTPYPVMPSSERRSFGPVSISRGRRHTSASDPGWTPHPIRPPSAGISNEHLHSRPSSASNEFASTGGRRNTVPAAAPSARYPYARRNPRPHEGGISAVSRSAHAVFTPPTAVSIPPQPSLPSSSSPTPRPAFMAQQTPTAPPQQYSEYTFYPGFSDSVNSSSLYNPNYDQMSQYAPQTESRTMLHPGSESFGIVMTRFWILSVANAFAPRARATVVETSEVMLNNSKQITSGIAEFLGNTSKNGLTSTVSRDTSLLQWQWLNIEVRSAISGMSRALRPRTVGDFGLTE